MDNDPLGSLDTPLFPHAVERASIEQLLAEALAELPERIAAGPVTPTLSRDQILHALASFDFAEQRPLPSLMSWLIAALERGLVHVNHPRYFGLFNPAPSFASQCGDRIAAAFNPQLATWTTSPVAVELERHLIRHVSARAGFPEGASGHFTTGGSEANATALICALTRAHAGFARQGARCFAGQLRVYISREAHLAWVKIAHQTGIGRDAICEVETDGMGRMSVRGLAARIEADRAVGCVPVLVVATAGTTGAGMIDPLQACGEVARRRGVWFHVDAAWGGAAIASERMRAALAGLADADSATIDAHKWFATTMGCGMFIIRDPSILSTAFQVATDYMPSNLEQLDPYVTTMQWSRRFLGIRLFLSLGTAGWNGYAAHIERSVHVADHIRRELLARRWRLLNDSPLAVLCVVPPDGSPTPQAIVRRVLASGHAFVSLTKFEGQPAVRACVTHGATSRDDVTTLVQALEGSLRA